MPFRPPSITITDETDVPGMTPAGYRRLALSRLRHTGKRFWTAVVLGVLAVGAAASALTLSLAPGAAPDVVPYPTVTGSLGDHLRELQESVEP
jgi:hypothetical protein